MDESLAAFVREVPSRDLRPKVVGVSPDGLVLRVAWAAGGGVAFDHFSVEEEADRVVVTGHMVRSVRAGAFFTLQMRVGEEHVALDATLGDREVVERVQVVKVD